MKYHFNEKEHIHQLFSEVKQEFENLTGTTTIIDVLGKNLTWWAAECAAIECLESGEKILTIRKEYLSACESGNKKIAIDALQEKYPIFKKARFAHFDTKNKKADEGTDLHAYLGDAVKVFMAGKIPESKEKKVNDFIEWSEQNVKKFLWSEMNCFSSLHFLGGIADAGAELNDGNVALIDFKSSKEAYFNQFVQCAGYAIQLEENGGYTAKGEKILTLEKPITKYIVFPFGGKELKPEIKEDTEQLKRAFLGLVAVYRVKGLLDYNN